jgi:hypothetical protein
MSLSRTRLRIAWFAQGFPPGNSAQNESGSLATSARRNDFRWATAGMLRELEPNRSVDNLLCVLLEHDLRGSLNPGATHRFTQQRISNVGLRLVRWGLSEHHQAIRVVRSAKNAIPTADEVLPERCLGLRFLANVEWPAPLGAFASEHLLIGYCLTTSPVIRQPLNPIGRLPVQEKSPEFSHQPIELASPSARRPHRWQSGPLGVLFGDYPAPLATFWGEAEIVHRLANLPRKPHVAF